MVQNITPNQAFEWLKSGEAILIDVREPDEFRDWHIPYAISLPLKKLESLFPTLQIPEGRKLIFQCLKGARGEKACLLVGQSGNIRNPIFNIDGGISNWSAASLPVIRVSGKISIFRQVQMIIGSLIASLVVLGFMGIWFAFALAGLFAFALAIAGFTGWCGLALILSKMPWNKT